MGGYSQKIFLMICYIYDLLALDNEHILGLERF